jgi:hypothetical protein
MNKKTIFLVMLVCLLAFVAVWSFAQNSPSIRWEYTAVRVIDESSTNQVTETCNRLGREGWELVTANSGSADMLIFKRRLP